MTCDPDLTAPASRCIAVTPSDTESLPVKSRAIMTNADGYVQITTIGGDVVRLLIVAGVPMPVRVDKIWATGTTATEIFVLA